MLVERDVVIGVAHEDSIYQSITTTEEIDSISIAFGGEGADT